MGVDPDQTTSGVGSTLHTSAKQPEGCLNTVNQAPCNQKLALRLNMMVHLFNDLQLHFERTRWIKMLVRSISPLRGPDCGEHHQKATDQDADADTTSHPIDPLRCLHIQPKDNVPFLVTPFWVGIHLLGSDLGSRPGDHLSAFVERGRRSLGPLESGRNANAKARS